MIQMCSTACMVFILMLMVFNGKSPQYSKYMVISFIVFCLATFLSLSGNQTSGSNSTSTGDLQDVDKDQQADITEDKKVDVQSEDVNANAVDTDNQYTIKEIGYMDSSVNVPE